MVLLVHHVASVCQLTCLLGSRSRLVAAFEIDSNHVYTPPLILSIIVMIYETQNVC